MAAKDDYTVKIKVIFEDFERKLTDSVKKVQPLMKEVFLGVLDVFAPELSVLIESIGNEMRRISDIIKGAKSGTFMERMTKRITGAEVVAGAEVAGAAGAAVATGAGSAMIAVVAIQSAIQIIKQILDYLKKASAVLGAVFKLIETGIMLMIRPIADFIGYILKPIVLLILRWFIIPFYRWVAPKIKEIGELWDKFIQENAIPIKKALLIAADILVNVMPQLLTLSLVILKTIYASLSDVKEKIVTVLSYNIAFIATLLKTMWNSLVNIIIVPLLSFLSWLKSKLEWFITEVIVPFVNAFSKILSGFGIFGGGLLPKVSVPQSIATSSAEMSQTLYVYPTIEIDTVNVGSMRDLTLLDEKINRAIADSLRRYGVSP